VLRRQIERYGRWLFVIGALVVVATACGVWILVNQRLQTPLDHHYTLRVEFETSAGLSPGLGNPVNVSGVRVGEIGSVSLRNGRSQVQLRIDPSKLPAVHRDARAMLVPNTPLQDLQVELQPGTARAGVMPDNGLIGIGRTSPPRNADEFLSVLDTDTRALFQALVGSLDEGTKGRTRQIRALLRAFEPTAKDLRAVSSSLAARRTELRRLVHNLSLLTGSVGRGDRELTTAVRAGGEVLRAVSAPDAQLREALRRLPGTAASARGALDDTERLANQLGPTARALVPAARKAPRALQAAGVLARAAEPSLRTRLRPLVRRSQPIAVHLGPATRDLSAVTPSLSSAFQVLTYLTNEIGYNPPGSDEWFVHWIAWFTHNLNSFVSTQDAHGAMWRGLALFDCTIVSRQQEVDQLLKGVFQQVQGC
jgi:phospholipid/cholesterol/gamma-HCH transport system substrate-binding protein